MYDHDNHVHDIRDAASGDLALLDQPKRKGFLAPHRYPWRVKRLNVPAFELMGEGQPPTDVNAKEGFYSSCGDPADPQISIGPGGISIKFKPTSEIRFEFWARATFWNSTTGLLPPHDQYPGDPTDPNPDDSATSTANGVSTPTGRPNPPSTPASGSLACACLCCRFLQIVIKSELTVNGSTYGTKVTPPFVDSQDYGEGNAIDATEGTTVDGSAPRVVDGEGRSNKTDSHGNNRISGYGDSEQVGPASKIARTHDIIMANNCPGQKLGYREGEGQGADSGGGCEYRMHDEPWRDLGGGSGTWKWEWISVGLILDSCHKDAIKGLCVFSRTDYGTFDENFLGFTEVTYVPPAPGDVTSNCGYNNPKNAKHKKDIDTALNRFRANSPAKGRR